MKIIEELLPVLTGIVLGILISVIAMTSYFRGDLNEYLPSIAPKVNIKYVDIGREYPQVKLYLKMRLGLPGFSGLLDSGCMEQLMNVLTKRGGTWEEEYCYDAYGHLTIQLEDRFSKMAALR